MDYITEELGGVVTAEQYGETEGRITILAPVFTDVEAGAWYYEPIMTAYNNGLRPASPPASSSPRPT